MVLSEGLRLVASGALMEKRITRAFETLNKLGETQTCEIVPECLGLKISALRLAHEFTEKREAEKEEQRQIREQMREEERVRRETTTMRALTKRRSRAPGGSAGHPGDGVLWSPPGNGGPSSTTSRIAAGRAAGQPWSPPPVIVSAP